MSKYLSSVSKSGQVNTPPGSYLTVKEWAKNSFIGPQSKLLEVGCSTGFISIEMARYTGSTCLGIDLHEQSVAIAQKNIDRFVADRVRFETGDAGAIAYERDSFSHVVVSGHLPFISHEQRKPHIEEALRVLKPWGYLLVALYYYHNTPPRELVDEFNGKIGTQLSPGGDKKYWTQFFLDSLLSLEYEAEYLVLPADEERIGQYVEQMASGTQDDWRDYLRLFNENGHYLSYFVHVYRKIPDEPGLMMQIPRGGIYRVRKKFSGEI